MREDVGTQICEMEKGREEESDRLLIEEARDPGVYTETQLARKVRLEREKLPEVDETVMPREAIEYIFSRQMALMSESAGLSRFQRALLELTVRGWSLAEISRKFCIPYGKLLRNLRIIHRKVERGSSPYYGLFEVYWSEVHRYIYRKHRSGH